MAAVDKFATYAPSPDSGFVGCAAVTPDDNADLAYVTDGLRSDSGGAVAVIFADGSTGTVSLLARADHRYRVARVKSTGTTATNIVALYCR